jgi:hypothetical protein
MRSRLNVAAVRKLLVRALIPCPQKILSSRRRKKKHEMLNKKLRQKVHKIVSAEEKNGRMLE